MFRHLRVETTVELEQVTRLYDTVLAVIEANDALYVAACEEWAAQGYIPQFCRHGVNLWVDYDPICGECENPTYSSNEAAALDRAMDVWERKRRRLQLIYALWGEIDDVALKDGLRAHLNALLTWADREVRAYAQPVG